LRPAELPQPFTLLLAAVCVLLFGRLALQIFAGTQTGVLLETVPRRYAHPSVRIDPPSATEDLAVIRDRALFYPARRFYVAPAPSAAPATPPKPEFRFAGAILIPNRPTVALLSNLSTHTSVKVRPGDDLGGWQVQAVERRRVILNFGTETATIEAAESNAAQGSTPGIITAPLNRGTRDNVATATTSKGVVRVLSPATTPTAASLPRKSGTPAISDRLYRPPTP
jgi:hypothetical protein